MRFLACLLLALVACGDRVDARGSYNTDCVTSRDCALPFFCVDAHCVLDAADVCEPGRTRCHGDAVEKCSDAGDRWEVTEDCFTGCVDSACRENVCVPNERRCNGDDLEVCGAQATEWVVVEHCPYACTDLRCTFCIPGTTRCVRDHLEAVCLEHGDEEALRDSCDDAGCRCP